MKTMLFFIDSQTTNNKKVPRCRKKLNKRKQNNYNLKTNLTFPFYKSILNKVRGYTIQKLQLFCEEISKYKIYIFKN